MDELNRKIREFADASVSGNEYRMHVSFLELMSEILRMVSDSLMIIANVHDFSHEFFDLLQGDITCVYNRLIQYTRYLFEINSGLERSNKRKRNRKGKRNNRNRKN